MVFDLNDNLRNARNIFIEAVRKTADSATQSSKGLFLTYDIMQLGRKKEHICRVIGERLTMLVKEGADVARDARMSELLSQLALIENELAERESEKVPFVNPFKTKKAPCECTTQCERKE